MTSPNRDPAKLYQQRQSFFGETSGCAEAANRYSNRQIRNHIKQHCTTDHWRGVAAVTLSVKQGIREHQHMFYTNEDRCSRIFGHFMRRLNRGIYGRPGRRSKKRLRVIPTIEKDKFGRWHIHAAIEMPPNTTENQFRRDILYYWAKSNDWAYRKNEIKLGNGGWVDYMLKLRQKSGLDHWSDCVDWHSFYNPINGG